jgi:hypothetical protein
MQRAPSPVLLALRERLILAAVGGALVGCSSNESTPNPKPGDTKPSRATGPTKTECFDPNTSMRTTGTGFAVPMPPSAFDSRGCLPVESVTNGCCNPAISGPEVVQGRCCYTFPAEAACCGRPFMVEGEAVVAEVVARSDWSQPTAEPPGALARESPRKHEHASIASFARFVMDLLSLGAPADLVDGAARALQDEVEHARLCFGIASRLSGRSMGGRSGSTPPRSLPSSSARSTTSRSAGNTT